MCETASSSPLTRSPRSPSMSSWSLQPRSSVTDGVQNRILADGESTKAIASDSSLTRSSAHRFRRVNSYVGCFAFDARADELPGPAAGAADAVVAIANVVGGSVRCVWPREPRFICGGGDSGERGWRESGGGLWIDEGPCYSCIYRTESSMARSGSPCCRNSHVMLWRSMLSLTSSS